MGSSYLPPPEQNVVNVGDELSQSALDAINAASFPSGTNPFRTMNDAGGGISSYDNFKIYQQGDLVIEADKLYRFNSYIGAAGYGPITHPSAWTEISAFPGFNNVALTGNSTAVTPATSDNDTSIATTAFVKAQGYLTSAPVTSVAGRTGAITLSNTDISGLGTMATATATDYLSKAGNLSGLANVTTARTNLGLGIANNVQFAGVFGSSESLAPEQHYYAYGVDSSGYYRSIQHRTSNTAEEGMGDNSYIDYTNSTNLTDSALSFSTTTYANAETVATEKTLSLNASSLSLAMSETGGAGLTLSSGNGLVVYDGSSGMSYAPNGIVFPDATFQTTAAVTFDPTGYATESWVSSQSYAQVSSVESHTGGSDSHDIIVTIGGVDYRIGARLV